MNAQRRTLKAWLRIGQALCVLLLVAWIAGHFWLITWRPTSGSGFFFVGSGYTGVFPSLPMSRFQNGLRFNPPSERFRWAPHEPVTFESGGGYVAVWLLLVAVAVPTFLVWRRSRPRRMPGTCVQCGYDLTGNTSGQCPECGTTIPKLDEFAT
jgi:hypothetical protein